MRYIRQYFVAICFASLALAIAIARLSAARAPESGQFDQITVHRINVIEPDGTLRMVISDHASFPGIIVRGKERPFSRPQAGMIFYNDEGSETGGLIFGGRRNANGELVDSGGSLSFDKYESGQIVQLAGVDDKEDRFAGLAVTYRDPNGSGNRRRIWVGRDEKGVASLALMDANGRKRILMEVSEDGKATLSFLDSNGKVLKQLSPSTSQ